MDTCGSKDENTMTMSSRDSNRKRSVRGMCLRKLCYIFQEVPSLTLKDHAMSLKYSFT